MSLPKRLALTFVLMSVLPSVVFSQTAASDENVRSLIRELRSNRWEGPIVSIPLQWNLLLTEPMRKILEIGSPAQQALIDNLSDPMIRDQVIPLLGGVGDERSIGPIILAMIRKRDLKIHSQLRTDQSGREYRSDEYYGRRCYLASRWWACTD